MSDFATGTSNSLILHPGAQTKALNRSVGVGISAEETPAGTLANAENSVRPADAVRRANTLFRNKRLQGESSAPSVLANPEPPSRRSATV